MGAKTGIEWTDATWNPLRGCSRVSEGCRNCYAEKVAYRFSGAGQPYEGLAVLKNGHARWTGKVELAEKHLPDPLKWRSPRRIFVNSMSDLFHESVPDGWIDRVFAVMALCPQHQFQVLTKRPERMLDYMRGHFRVCRPGPRELAFTYVKQIPSYDSEHPKWIRLAANAFNVLPLPNVWLGVSVENQASADMRIPLLLHTPAAVRFISAEPLLGPIRLDRGHEEECAGDFEDCAECGSSSMFTDFFTAHAFCAGKECSAPGEALALGRIDWVIAGGESGTGARPMHPDWARSLRDQCKAADVPFFFKQWGEWTEVGGGPPHRMHEVDHSPLDTTVPIDSTNCVLSVDGHRPAAQGDMRPGLPYRWLSRIGKHTAGSLLDGMEHKNFPGARVKEGVLV